VREATTLAAAAIARYSFAFGDVRADAAAGVARPQFDPQADYWRALACGIKIVYFAHYADSLAALQRRAVVERTGFEPVARFGFLDLAPRTCPPRWKCIGRSSSGRPFAFKKRLGGGARALPVFQLFDGSVFSRVDPDWLWETEFGALIPPRNRARIDLVSLRDLGIGQQAGGNCRGSFAHRYAPSKNVA